MKKRVYQLTLMLTILFAVVSCDKEQELVDQNTTKKEKIKSLLKEKGFSSVRFVDKEDTAINKEKALKFNSIEDFKKFLSEKNTTSILQSRDAFTHVDNEGSGTGVDQEGYFIAKHQIDWAHYLNVGFNVKDCKASNFNSWLSGFTFALSYTQMGYYANTNSNGTEINYHVTGVIDVNVIIEDIGTIVTENISVAGTYFCKK